MEITAGIDLGSVTTKCAVVTGGRIIGQALVKAGPEAKTAAEEVFQLALQNAGLARAGVGRVVSTGYGRRLFPGADFVVTEIAAAAAGAHALVGGRPCLVLDVGGQDTKVIEAGASGEVLDFVMNDKCAAGTGRFLEMMAGILATDLDGMSELAAGSRNPVTINATCSVFAESEVVSLIAGAAGREDIAAGLFASIASRIANMLRQFDRRKELFFCGGGARSQALQNALEKALGRTVQILDNPQFVAAYGAALAVRQDLSSSRRGL